MKLPGGEIRIRMVPFVEVAKSDEETQIAALNLLAPPASLGFHQRDSCLAISVFGSGGKGAVLATTNAHSPPRFDQLIQLLLQAASLSFTIADSHQQLVDCFARAMSFHGQVRTVPFNTKLDSARHFGRDGRDGPGQKLGNLRLVVERRHLESGQRVVPGLLHAQGLGLATTLNGHDAFGLDPAAGTQAAVAVLAKMIEHIARTHAHERLEMLPAKREDGLLPFGSDSQALVQKGKSPAEHQGDFV